jgi:hypothetical protein
MEHSVTGARAAARNLANLAISEATALPYLPSAGPMDKNGDELRQPVMENGEAVELRAGRSSRCEESLR